VFALGGTLYALLTGAPPSYDEKEAVKRKSGLGKRRGIC
jgi:hypothetical protein